ncbi:hypothetical protein [Pararhizobium mangrovi]|uniref:Uncharacterized protein n=1 Tax=Pararhizobium mangrovi TaxID=2590452 RepID=A0A506U8Z0_9HYPH|nr:hypothetical protein [Pararhizobium mangrovi]TPW30360.1 hypothetical protein FJU11_04955 [Pararhizobium mangrovi]
MPTSRRSAAKRRSVFAERILADDVHTLTPAILLFLCAPLLVLLSQALRHTYSFGELGFLLPFTVYDVALATLGLGVLCAGLASMRRFAIVVTVFCGTLVVCLFRFVEVWQAFFLPHDLDTQVYLVTPIAVGLTGVALWLPQRVRFPAALVLAVLLGADYTLFIGLQDYFNDLDTFGIGALAACAWILAAPAFLLRHFKRPWLTIAGRILGSWLVAIELLIFAFAKIPITPPTG